MYRIPFSNDSLKFELPANIRATCLTSRPIEPLADVEGAIAKALAAPINSPPLRKMAKRGDTACIVFTDITRDSPDHLLVPALLAELQTAGVRDEDITLVCGTGLHRPSTRKEKVIKLGKAVIDRYRVVDHEPLNRDRLTDLGVTESGVPLSVNRLAYEADMVFSTGTVEPHQFAGYSGGPKTLAIGAAGEPTIAHTHNPQMIDDQGTRLGKIDGNLFHEAITEAARRAGLRFILNVVQDEQRRAIAILAGEPELTFKELVKAAGRLYEIPIPQQYDVVVAGVGFPKDINMYQASRAASQLFFAPCCPVKKGGVFIVPAPTPEGAGSGVGERRFLEKMRNAVNMSSLLAELRSTGYLPGIQRAFVIAKVLEKAHIIVVGTETPEVVRQLRMIPAADMDEAFHIAISKIGRKDLDALIVPKALLTLPVGCQG